MLQKLLNMGGYAAYVWPAYAIVIAALGINAWQSIRKLCVIHENKNAETSTTNNYSY